MSIKVIDTLSPLGNFPVAQAKDIDVNGTALNTVLSGKANTTDVNAKADKSYVDTQLETKANSSAVTAKADKTYVDTELAKKADTTAVNSKVDKVTGKGLSTNDYDNTEKSKVNALNGMFSIVD